MNIYIDKTLGADDSSHGGQPGVGAFATRQYAWNTIPDIYHENIFIFTSNDVYDDPLVMAGKRAGGDFHIVWIASQVLLTSGQIESSLQGGGAVDGSIHASGYFGGYANKLLYTPEPVPQWEIIESGTLDSLTISGAFYEGAPTGLYYIYDWGTKFAGDVAIIGVNQQQVVFKGLDIQGVSMAQSASYDVQFEFKYCRITGQFGYEAGSKCFVRQSLFVGGDNFVHVTDNAVMELVQCKHILGTSIYGVYSCTGGRLYMDGGCVLEGNNAAPGTIGAYATQDGQIFFDPLHSGPMGHARIRNWGIGIKTDTGGEIQGYETNEYSGNLQNESFVDMPRRNYSPLWLSTGNPQPSIGNGSLSGTYSIKGGIYKIYISLVPGSQTNFGTGAWMFSTPTPIKSQLIDSALGMHAGAFLNGQTFWNGSLTTFVVLSPAGLWGKTVPVAWAPGDYMVAQYQYYG